MGNERRWLTDAKWQAKHIQPDAPIPENRLPWAVESAGPDEQRAVMAAVAAADAYQDAFDELEEAVRRMRQLGVSWESVGWAVGTSGSAARKRFLAATGGRVRRPRQQGVRLP